METVDILISEGDLQKRVFELGKQISEDYRGKTLRLVCVLKGGVMFMVDLARALDLTVEYDFMAVSSYGGGMESSNTIKINMDLAHSIEGRDVLVVEDIVDTGRTLSALYKHLEAHSPNSLRLCALLDKPSRRESGVMPDYTGFVIEDEFVVGYGMDYAERYRNLPFIGVLRLSE